MKFSTKTRYAIRAMGEIALAPPETGVFQKDIAERQKISYKYLDHIIQALKTAGLVYTVRGKKSGYVLARPAAGITMYDIHRAFEPDICVVECMSQNVQCPIADMCISRGFWTGMNNLVKDYMKNTTLNDLIKHKNKT